MNAAEILSVIEAHLFNGMVRCSCGWAISTLQRPFDPLGQQREHVAEQIADALSREECAS